MSKQNICLMIVLLAALTGCTGEVQHKEWDDIDYERIARENYKRENDPNYTPPTVIGCVDDDLYNCPVKRR